MFSKAFKKNNKINFDLHRGIKHVEDKYKNSYYWAPFLKVSIPSSYNRELNLNNEKIFLDKIKQQEHIKIQNEKFDMAFIAGWEEYHDKKVSLNHILVSGEDQKSNIGIQLISKFNADKLKQKQ